MNMYSSLTSHDSYDRRVVGASLVRAWTAGVFLMLGILPIGTTVTQGQSASEEWLPRPAIINAPSPSAPASGVACLGTHPLGGNLVISPYGVASLISSNRVSPVSGLTLPLVGHDLRFADDGSVFIFGETNASITADGMVWELSGGFVAKYNRALRLLWAANLPTDPSNSPVKGVPTPEGGVVTSRSLLGSTWVTRLDEEGKPDWTRRFTNLVTRTLTRDDQQRITLGGTFSGTVMVGDVTLTSRGGEDVAIIQLDASGGLLWVQHLGGSLADSLVGLGADQEGNLVVASLFTRRTQIESHEVTAEGGVGLDVALLGLTAEGSVRWLHSVGGLGDDDAQDLVVDQEGNSYLAYSHMDGPPETPIPQISKFDGSGTQVWSRKLDSSRGGKEEDLPFTRLVSDRSGNLLALAVAKNLVFASNDNIFAGQNAVFSIATTNPERIEEMDLSLSTYAGLTIEGRAGRTYRIERRDDLSEVSPWVAVDQITLPRTPYLWTDSTSNRRSHGLYRLILLP